MPKSSQTLAAPPATPLDLIPDVVDQGIYILDGAGRCTLFNRAASLMTGWLPGEGVGRFIHELIDPRQQSGAPHLPAECTAPAALPTGTGARKGRAIYLKRDTTPFPVEYLSTPIVENGRTVGAIVVFTDITERLKTEKALHDLNEALCLITDSGPTLIASCDAGCGYSWVNGAYARWVGRAAGEIKGRHIRQVLGEAAWQTIQPYCRRVMSGETVAYEHQLALPDGPRWLRGTCTPYFDDVGQVCGFVEYAVDIGEHKDAAETYRATLNILEDFDEERRNVQLLQKATINLLEDMYDERNRVAQTQRATLNLLEDMNAEREKSNETQRALINILDDAEVERSKADRAKTLLESVNKELEAFSYSVSHDLRAPLRAISGFTEALLEDWAPRLDDEGRRYLGLVRENAHKMGQLIDDLLAFSRLGRQTMTVTEIDMAELAQTVFDELKPETPGRCIVFTTGTIPPAHGDKALIRQVLVNLFANAIKFTRTREKAIVEFGCRPAGDRDDYFVRDNGVGFEMQYIDKLFGVFQRLHSVAEFEGTGVGLALVSRIITRHGGTVRAEGDVDCGATFYFSLPNGGRR